MDRRTIIGIVLAVGVYFAWLSWVESTRPPVEEVTTEAVADISELPGPVEATAPVPVAPADDLVRVASTPLRTGTFQGCGATFDWSTDGGRITNVGFDDYKNPYEVTPIWRHVGNLVQGKAEGGWKPYGDDPGRENLLQGNAQVLGLGAGALDRRSADVTVVREAADELVVRGTTSDGIEVTRRLSVISGDPCRMAVDVTWRNTTTDPYDDGVWMSMHDDMPGSYGRYANAVRPFASADGDYETWNKLEKITGPEPMPGTVDWMALADRYFTFALVPSGTNAGTAVFSPVQSGDLTMYGVHYKVGRTIEPGESIAESFVLYVGPKEHGILKELAPGLNKLVQLGWFAFFGRFLLMLLHMFYGLIGNWGVSIIALTLLVKGAFFPLTQTSFRSSQAMQAIQPKLQEVRERYKDSPEELNKQTLALFRDNGVNPLAGCLPMLVQMPVWIALYNVLLSSVDLYQVEFLYMKDLSSVDPYCILPAIVVVLMLVQQRFMPTGNMDPTQARLMKMMPLLFGFFFFTFPSGLVIYIFFNMVLTILQQWWIKRSYAMAAPNMGVSNG
ncbi:MAG: YidC/Oxa1 family membrane protein insertase [Myxococcota bacterium]|jgi:YidC/Oxa1 family membrane protein insertase